MNPLAAAAASAAFCSFDESLDSILAPLHAQLRSGTKSAQLEIDRYIVACSLPCLRTMVLHKHTIPHYDNLPDIQSLIIGVLDTTVDTSNCSNLQQIFLLMRQCTPLRRRTKRAQREVQWREVSFPGMQTLVRSTQGTLLGLYPSCTRPVAFKWRTRIYAFIRTLLVQPFKKLNRCMGRIRYVCKLCIMEHLCNTVCDYYPGIMHVLNKNGEQMKAFSQAVFTMCDIFRNEINAAFVTHKGDTLSAFVVLDNVARSLFERCTRSYRGAIVNTDQQRRMQVQKRIQIGALVSEEVFQMLSNAHMTRTQYVFQAIHQGVIPVHMMDAIWGILQNVQTSELPFCVQERQYQAICRANFMDQAVIRTRQLVHICVFCAFKHGTSSCRKRTDKPNTVLNWTKFRIDCQTQSLLCVACNSPSVIAINLLGRVLRLGRTLLVLSACCGTVIRYTGSGLEFSETCGPQCSTQPIAPASKKTCRAMCKVCNQRGVQQTIHVLDVPTRSIVSHVLCGRHRIPDHLGHTVYDSRELAAVQNTLAATARAKN